MGVEKILDERNYIVEVNPADGKFTINAVVDCK